PAAPPAPRPPGAKTVLVAGKAHEKGQEIAGVVRPFDDRQVLREAIADRSHTRASAPSGTASHQNSQG
ncbi:UDP-N-acetylmuramoyl-L-alanyl-D-glutamate--2,6-diaminopimelate ligase, partial [Streptomyces sp. NPDC059556]